MNKIILKIALFGILCTPLSICAQNVNALGCNNSSRYLLDIFPNVTSTITQQYGTARNSAGFNISLYTDVFEPTGDTLTRRPLIIWAFGGGFVTGQRADMSAFANAFAKKGFVCATIDYRLYSVLQGVPDSVRIGRQIVQAVQDMKASVRYFRKDAATQNRFRVDTNNIIVAGISAGAITAMCTAAMDTTDNIAAWVRTLIAEQGGLEGASGNAGYGTSVKAAINMSGALLDRSWIDAGDPPFISYHGTADNVVPYARANNVYSFISEGSSLLHEQAQRVGVKSALITVQGGGHTDIYSDPRYATQLATFTAMTIRFNRSIVCGEFFSNANDIAATQMPVSIAPNPSNAEMLISTEGVENMTITVTDLLGRTVFMQKNNTNTFVLHKNDVKDAGVYLLKIEGEKAGQKQQTVRKVVFE